MFSSDVNHRWCCVFRIGPRRYIYSRRACSTDPQHSINSPVLDLSFPETVPLHRWGTRRKGSPTITLVKDQSKVSGLEGADKEILVFLQFGVSGIEGEQSFEDEESPARRAGDNCSARRSAVEERHHWGHHRPRALRQCVRCHRPKESATRAAAKGN